MTDAVLEKLRLSLLELDKDATLEAVRSLVDGGNRSASAGAGVAALTNALDEVGRRRHEGIREDSQPAAGVALERLLLPGVPGAAQQAHRR